MRTAAAVQWWKEFRELLPIWCLTVAVMGVSWALMNPDVLPFDGLYSWAVKEDAGQMFVTGLCFYAAGAVILGALSIGQEYSNNTLSQLLIQPSRRTRVLRIKLLVLSALLISLGGWAFVIWRNEPWLSFTTDLQKVTALAVPLASGLFLAPWLTMVGRSALAGAVLASVLPAVTYLTMPGWLWWPTGLTLVAFAAGMTWRTFSRLEVGGNSWRAMEVITASGWPRSQSMAVKARSAFSALLSKELQLHRLTFMTCGVYLVLCAFRVVSDAVAPLSVLSQARFDQLYGVLLPMVAGAVAIAEERRLRVHEWQVLLPVAAWKQWVMKAGVSVSLALVLGFALSALIDNGSYRPPVTPGVTVLFCAAALYMSSISSSVLRALMATGPVAAATFLTAVTVLELVDLGQPVRWLTHALQATQLDYETYSRWIGWFVYAPTALITLLLARFSFLNYRRPADSRAIRRQFGWLLVGGIGLLVSVGINSYLLALFRK